MLPRWLEGTRTLRSRPRPQRRSVHRPQGRPWSCVPRRLRPRPDRRPPPPTRRRPKTTRPGRNASQAGLQLALRRAPSSSNPHRFRLPPAPHRPRCEPPAPRRPRCEPPAPRRPRCAPPAPRRPRCEPPALRRPRCGLTARPPRRSGPRRRDQCPRDRPPPPLRRARRQPPPASRRATPRCSGVVCRGQLPTRGAPPGRSPQTAIRTPETGAPATVDERRGARRHRPCPQAARLRR